MFEPIAAETVEALIEGFSPPPSPSENGCFGMYHIGQNRYHDST